MLRVSNGRAAGCVIQPISGADSIHSASMAEQPSRATPNEVEIRSWRSFLRAHATIIRRLEDELLDEQGLSLATYDVLVQLVEAPGRRLRMTELADAVLLSRSGVTRLVDRMERDGLVARQRVDGDGRGVVAELTEAGLQRLRGASKTHLAGVVRHFVAALEPEQLREFGATCEQLASPPPRDFGVAALGGTVQGRELRG